MSGKNKNYNSIIFLTTLSVYLSISLLGATPQVLAYAATTRNFDIQTEIEYKDDLDNKPDEESSENQAEDFPKIFTDFLTEIRQNSGAKLFKDSFYENFQSQSYVKPDIIFGNESRTANGLSESNQPLAILSDKFIYSRLFPNALKIAEYKNLYNSGTHIGHGREATAKIKGDKKELIFEVSFSKSRAEVFADYLNTKYVSLAKETNETPLKKFYENTKISFKDNQIFIVTNLPRAAIDSSIQ